MRWFGLALLGLLVAAAVAVVASRLVSQQIGLASEPISAGDALAPAPHHRSAPKAPPEPTRPPEPKPTPESTAPAPQPSPEAAPTDDYGGGSDSDD